MTNRHTFELRQCHNVVSKLRNAGPEQMHEVILDRTVQANMGHQPHGQECEQISNCHPLQKEMVVSIICLTSMTPSYGNRDSQGHSDQRLWL